MSKILTKEVSFSLAKLLKEKEYNEKPNYIKSITDYVKGYCFDVEDKDSTLEIIEFQFEDNVRSNYYLMPTISEVIDWIYENYGIWIDVIIFNDSKFIYSVWKVIPNKRMTQLNESEDVEFNTPSEAYEKAIEYTLKELIK